MATSRRVRRCVLFAVTCWSVVEHTDSTICSAMHNVPLRSAPTGRRANYASASVRQGRWPSARLSVVAVCALPSSYLTHTIGSMCSRAAAPPSLFSPQRLIGRPTPCAPFIVVSVPTNHDRSGRRYDYYYYVALSRSMRLSWLHGRYLECRAVGVVAIWTNSHACR